MSNRSRVAQEAFFARIVNLLPRTFETSNWRAMSAGRIDRKIFVLCSWSRARFTSRWRGDFELSE